MVPELGAEQAKLDHDGWLLDRLGESLFAGEEENRFDELQPREMMVVVSP